MVVRRIVRLSFAAVWVILAQAAGAYGQEAPQEGVGIRLLEVPVDRAPDARAQRYVIDHVDPGTVIRRRIEVVNHDSSPTVVRLYAAGAVVEDGEFQPAEDESGGEIARWTRLDRSSVELPARTSAELTATITVPTDASAGERYGAIWAELPPSEGSAVTVVNRVGIRIYLSVGEGGEPASDFEVDTLTAARGADGTPVVKAKVRNTGGRALDMRGELSLTDGPGSLSAGPFPAQLGTTLGLGQEGDVLVPLDPEIPAGPWTATLTLSSGTLERTVQGTITFPDAAGVSAPPVRAERVVDSMRGLIIVGVALLLILLLLLLILWRLVLYVRKRHRDRNDDESKARPEERTPEPVG